MGLCERRVLETSDVIFDIILTGWGQEDWDDWGQEGDWFDGWEERAEWKHKGKSRS